MSTSQPKFDRDRIIFKAERLLKHLETATRALDGKGSSIEEMAAAVRRAHELALDLKGFLTIVEE